jgi:hypothetical protein
MLAPTRDCTHTLYPRGFQIVRRPCCFALSRWRESGEVPRSFECIKGVQGFIAKVVEYTVSPLPIPNIPQIGLRLSWPRGATGWPRSKARKGGADVATAPPRVK